MTFRPLVIAAFVLAPLAGMSTAVAKPGSPMHALVFPASTAEIPAPPKLSDQARYLTNVETATFKGTVPAVRRFMDANPVTDFVTATEAIPAIAGFEVVSGNWPEPGAVRRVDLADGNSVHERVLINSDNRFAYQIWNITAPAGRAVDHIMGEFQFDQQGSDVVVTWTYNIKPSVFFARPAINRYLREDFGPFMNAGLSGTANAYKQR